METRRPTSTSGKLPEALLAALLFSLPLLSCAPDRSPDPPPATAASGAVTTGASEANLRNFALANCLFAYFQKRGWDTRDIRGIAGGYVETGDSPAESYARIAEAVRAWQPDIRTKQDLDVELLKCFHLDDSESIGRLIAEGARP